MIRGRGGGGYKFNQFIDKFEILPIATIDINACIIIETTLMNRTALRHFINSWCVKYVAFVSKSKS